MNKTHNGQCCFNYASTEQALNQKKNMRHLFLLCLVWVIALAHKDPQHPHFPPKPSQKFLRKSQTLNPEQTTDYWMQQAQSILAHKLQKVNTLNTNKAKNVIFFLGDGMSVHTITATRNFLGDSNKQVSFEKFPYTGLSRTYSVDKRVPDSAATATAYLCGVKANYGTIGVNAQVERYDCFKANDTNTHTDSLAKWAQDAGKWAGLVTTAGVTHASPAGLYAHVANRGWEHNQAVVKDGCSAEVNVDIARQLVEWPVGKDLHVVMGGGRGNFRPQTIKDEEGFKGRRTDNRDLIKEWLSEKKRDNKPAKYVWSKKGLAEVDFNKTDYLMGLFSTSHCPYHGDLKRNNLDKSDPSLTDMTEAAIKILQKSPQGYFLFVEGAKIDMAHHETRAHKSLEDTAEFARAIDLARHMTSEEDTLIVVTSDHSHTMTINGYPDREQKIFELAPKLADDGLPYSILSYANGQGYYNTYSEKGRQNLAKANLNNPEYRFMTTVPLDKETHGADDVAVFASGPGEQYFSGNYEQSNIPALIANIANMGPFSDDKL